MMKMKRFWALLISVAIMLPFTSLVVAGKKIEKVDLSDYARKMAPVMSDEDRKIYENIQEKSSNPNKMVWRHAVIVRNMDDAPNMRGERQFLIELKKRLGDKIEFQIFYNGAMGTTADQVLGGLQNRNFETASYNVGAFAEYTKAWTPLDVMFLIPDLETGIAVVSGEPGELMNQRCIEDCGVNVLVRGAIGMRHMTTSKRPIKKVEDLKGLKIRVQNNPLHILAMKAFGCSPTPIAYAELFTSLQQKVIDGQENPISNIFDQNYMEVQDYMILTNHMYTAGAVAIYNDFLLSLSPEFQQAIKESAAIAQAYSGPDLMNTEAGMLEYMKQGMEISELSPEEFKKFQEIASTTWQQAAKTIGPEYFEKVKASIEKVIEEVKAKRATK
jgi:tripartite ATP-independent transporter DctP family solute receptor